MTTILVPGQPDPPPPIPSVLALLPDWNACSAWRIAWPFKYLQSQGVNARYMPMHDPRATAAIEAFDIVLFQRLVWLDTAGGREALDKVRAGGRRLVLLEVDDDMWVSRDEQKSHEELGFAEPEAPIEQQRESVQLYDGVIVSSERLRTSIHSFAPRLPVQVVPNAIDLDFWERQSAGWVADGKRRSRNIPRDITTIGWFGGDRYDRDVLPLAAAWRRVAAMHPQVHFVIMGHQLPPLVDAVPSDRLHQIQWLPLESRPDVPFYGVGLREIDIGCAIVAPTMFNAAKTPIKIWEYTAAGAAVVASRWLYGPYVQHGNDGLVVDDADEVDGWVRHIDALVRKPKLRRTMQRRMLMKVRARHTVAVNAWRHVAAWCSIREAVGRHVLLPEGVHASAQATT